MVEIECNSCKVSMAGYCKYENLIDDYGWELVQGEARFLDAHTFSVGTRNFKANASILATGADPAVPEIPGLMEAGYLTSTSALALAELPESLFIIGAGYIALELGQLFSRLGTKVTLVQRSSRLLPDYETEVGMLMHDQLTADGIELLLGGQIESVERHEGSRRICLTINGGRVIREASHILVATGRKPNTAALRLEAAGVRLDGRGAIEVNSQLQTTNPHIWAAGDVTLHPQFVYVAAYEGTLAAENALLITQKAIDFTALPSVIFTNPQVAVVGLTETEAQLQGRKVESRVLPLDAVPRAQVNHNTTGLVKIVAEPGSGRILGVHMVADNAGDVIYAGTLAVKFGLTIKDLVETFAPYLTMSEGMKLAAQTFERDVRKLSCCAA